MSLQPEESSGDEKHQRGERSRNEQELWHPTYGDAPVGYTDPGSKSIFHLCSCHLCHYHYEGRVGPRFGLRHTDSITMENKSLSPCQGFPSLKHRVKRGGPSRPLDGYADVSNGHIIKMGIIHPNCKALHEAVVDLMICQLRRHDWLTGCHRYGERCKEDHGDEQHGSSHNDITGQRGDDKSDDAGIRGPSYANEADTM